jgi:hypothetical protein
MGLSTKMAGEDITNDVLRTGRWATTVTTNKTRPADTTAYAAGDVVNESTSAGTVWTFAAMGRYNAGTGRIVGARLVSDADVATEGDFELWLFSSSVATVNDNAAWAPTDAEMRNLVGTIAFGSTPKVGSGNVAYQVQEGSGGLPIRYKCGAGLTDLYGVLVVRNAYSPASGGRLDIYLDIKQD